MAFTESRYLHIAESTMIGLCARDFYTLDGLWFSLVEERYGLEAALAIDVAVWRKFVLIHVRRLLNGADAVNHNPLRTLAGLLQVDPVNMNFNPEIVALTDNRLVVRCINCAPQRARIRDGRGEFPCKQVGIALNSSYAEIVDPEIKVTCLTCPADAHPADYWCEWQFEI